MLLHDFRAHQPESQSLICDWLLRNTNRNRRKKEPFPTIPEKIRERNDSSRHFRSYWLFPQPTGPLREGAQSTRRTKRSGD
ncbi:hypothetical protein CEXT_651011 [Caerostris extrusa]|uniref:Uncharacterized protein n=1 Tax=Caerostris extrusa TaxID=172846 RepID=A0AAV4Y1E4_CAEEX|nr:hypothetical protein CEXT_651011 [Caerostris extrusa]